MNHPFLSVAKTKEMVVDFRRKWKRTRTSPITITGQGFELENTSDTLGEGQLRGCVHQRDGQTQVSEEAQALQCLLEGFRDLLPVCGS